MHVKNQFLVLLVLSSWLLYAQSEEERLSVIDSKKKYYLGISTSAILNKYPAVQLSQEYCISPNFRLGLETGYIFSSIFDHNSKNVRGFRIRPAVKYSIQNKKDEFFSFLIFYNYRHTQADKQREIWRNTGGYSEFIRGTQSMVFAGPGVGFDKGFSMKDWFFRFGFGIGVGEIRNVYNPPELQIEPGNFLFSSPFNDLQNYAPIWYINLCFGLM